MSQSEDNTCEYCRADLPRGAATHFCNELCYDAHLLEAREQAQRVWVGLAKVAAKAAGLGEVDVEVVPTNLLPEKP
jgi:hypothetical protein